MGIFKFMTEWEFESFLNSYCHEDPKWNGWDFEKFYIREAEREKLKNPIELTPPGTTYAKRKYCEKELLDEILYQTNPN